MTRAVVFAYHDVGVRCLEVLLAHQIRPALVITHADNSNETIWFDSVAAMAVRYELQVALDPDPRSVEFAQRVAALRPEFLFSFYYRQMLPPALLALASRGAFNMHGSLLPKYRGRVPVNWAVIHGERETGATLHEMTAKPDAGRIVDQATIPILPNDLAVDVFRKVTVAAEIVLDRTLPRLLAGNCELRAQDLTQGAYFSGRRAEDGRINWRAGAWQVHNLVRAVAPPYPGAFCDTAAGRLEILRTHWQGERAMPRAMSRVVSSCVPCLFLDGNHIRIQAIDGGSLSVESARVNAQELAPHNFVQLLGGTKLEFTVPSAP